MPMIKLGEVMTFYSAGTAKGQGKTAVVITFGERYDFLFAKTCYNFSKLEEILELR